VEAVFFLQLLVSLFADPARLDGCSELLERGVGRKVGEIIFALAGRAMFADDPDFLARQVLGAHLAYSLGGTVSDAHAHGAKARRQSSLRAATPGDRPPSGLAVGVLAKCRRVL